MKLYSLFLSTVLVTSAIAETTMSQPRSFNELEKNFQVAQRPLVDSYLDKKLKGGCFTPLSDVNFINDFELSFSLDNQAYMATYNDPNTGVTSSYKNLILNEFSIDTRPETLSQDAYFMMSYKEYDGYLIEKIAMKHLNSTEEFVVNFCYYSL